MLIDSDMCVPLCETLCSGQGNLWQVNGVRTGSGDTSSVNLDQDQIVRFLDDQLYINHFQPSVPILAL